MRIRRGGGVDTIGRPSAPRRHLACTVHQSEPFPSSRACRGISPRWRSRSERHALVKRAAGGRVRDVIPRQARDDREGGARAEAGPWERCTSAGLGMTGKGARQQGPEVGKGARRAGGARLKRDGEGASFRGRCMWTPGRTPRVRPCEGAELVRAMFEKAQA